MARAILALLLPCLHLNASSDFPEPASGNPLAWFRKAHTADSLFNLMDRDRMVAYPFTRNTMAFMDIEFLDLYSCFASNLNFSRDVLGIADDDPRPLTVTGGLPYFGGPGNNYTTHSMAAMVAVLRDHPGSRGLVTGVGMHMTNHSFAVYSSTPRDLHPSASRAVEGPRRDIVAQAAGAAIIAGYTVVHAGAAPHVLAVCELPGGARCYARCDNAGVAAAMQAEEWVGRTVNLSGENGVNIMTC